MKIPMAYCVQHEKIMPQEWCISDVFGLRSPVLQKKNRQKTVYLYRRTRDKLREETKEYLNGFTGAGNETP